MAAVPVTDISDPSELSDSQLLRHIFASVKRMEAANTAQQEKIAKLESEVSMLNKKVYQLENTINLREQELKSLTVRVTGLPFTDEEKATTDGKYLCKKVYDRIVQPLLIQAKSANFIDRVPTMANAISDCYRLCANSAITGTASPPSIVLKFSSEQIRLGVMRTKQLHMPKPNQAERDMGISNFCINEDLTPATYSMLKTLRREEEVTRTWTINGRIKFLLSEDKRVHTVPSVFDTVESILAKIKK